MSFRREGGARLLHFRSEATVAKPILLVPSLINRWYVLDLRPGASLVEALVCGGFDVWLLDWGVPEPEDRYLDWDSVLRRRGRAVRRVLAKLMSQPDLTLDPKARDAYLALDAWASDNIPFPAEAYRRYISEMYQGNELIAGTHRANGQPAQLGKIKCPTMVITASRDAICPPLAATALLRHIGSTDTSVLEVPGGHVGAVVGSRAGTEMYPGLARWLAPRLA